jgi:hypothetical protein
MSKKCTCGKMIEFVKVGDKTIPCDPSAPIYEITPGKVEGTFVGERTAEQLPGMFDLFASEYWVSHFNTCPDAGAYSQAKGERLEQLARLLSAVDSVLGAETDGQELAADEALAKLFESLTVLRLARELLK